MTDTTDSPTPDQPTPDDGFDDSGVPFDPPDLSRRSSARINFGLAFILGLIAALLLGVGALYAYDRQFTGRILPGVHVGTADLSGMNADEARSALQQAYGSLSEGRLVLTESSGEHVISYV